MLTPPRIHIIAGPIRVTQGGHNIPPDVIKRRFTSGLRNLNTIYKPLVNRWFYYDASNSPPLLIEKKVRA